MTARYGFRAEVLFKYDKDVYMKILSVFCALPLALVLDENVLVLHGGLYSRQDVKLSDIESINRFREPPHDASDLMMETLWSDPSEDGQLGIIRNRRGGNTICFGEDVSSKFLQNNGLNLLIRSHQVKHDGAEVHHGGRVITIFSAPNYVDRRGNRGAIAIFEKGTRKMRLLQFDASKHPDIPPMAYIRSRRARL